MGGADEQQRMERPELTSDIDQMMARFLQRINEWPETDLFSYSAPVPLRF
jgi:hypothetical protein